MSLASLSVEQENAFALSLYRQLSVKASAAKLDNAMLCPGGVTRLLRAIHAGAKGRTASEIAGAIGLDAKASMAEAPAPAAGSDVLKVASALWADPAVPFLPGYEQTVKDALGAHAASVPLAKDAEAARQTINQWAAEQTGGNIQELLKRGDLRGAQLVLTDAAWFKDSWKSAFKPERTTDAEFTLPDGKKRLVAFVADTRAARVGATPDGEILALPFAAPRYECLCVLPAMRSKESAGSALLRFERELKPETLAAFHAALAEQPHVDMQLPKLDLKGLAADLISPLQALGIKTAFTNAADLSGMTEKGADLKIGVFRQDTAFRLDESGAEASAATTAVMITKSAISPVKPVIFHANRPCLFLIRDTETGGIVFIIRCATPAEAAHPTPSSTVPVEPPAKPDATPPGGEAKPPGATSAPGN
jgi:serine protease inhibitor